MSLSDLLSELMQRTEIPAERDMLWLDPCPAAEVSGCVFFALRMLGFSQTNRKNPGKPKDGKEQRQRKP